MANHQCNCCPSCQQDLARLRQNNQALLTDYAILTKKHQLTINKESAYLQFQQENTQKNIQQAAKIIQLQEEIRYLNNILGPRAEGPTLTQFDNESFRRDVNHNQELNTIIDAKNRQIWAMKEQARGTTNLIKENQQLRSRNSQIQSRLILSERRTKELEIEKQSLNSKIQTLQRDYFNSQQQLNNRQPEGYREQNGSTNKIIQERQLAFNYPRNSIKNQSTLASSLTYSQDQKYREHANPRNIQRSRGVKSQLFLQSSNQEVGGGRSSSKLQQIKSRISELQMENDMLRSELYSNI